MSTKSKIVFSESAKDSPLSPQRKLFEKKEKKEKKEKEEDVEEEEPSTQDSEGLARGLESSKKERKVSFFETVTSKGKENDSPKKKMPQLNSKTGCPRVIRRGPRAGDTCGKAKHKRGICSYHYQQWKKIPGNAFV